MTVWLMTVWLMTVWMAMVWLVSDRQSSPGAVAICCGGSSWDWARLSW